MPEHQDCGRWLLQRKSLDVPVCHDFGDGSNDHETLVGGVFNENLGSLPEHRVCFILTHQELEFLDRHIERQEILAVVLLVDLVVVCQVQADLGKFRGSFGVKHEDFFWGY